MIARVIVAFYRIWHGRWDLPGAGWLLRTTAPYLHGLQSFPLEIGGFGTICIDLRDHAGLVWLRHLEGFPVAPWDDEAALVLTVADLAPNNGRVWDIGANLGLFASQLLRLRPDLRLVAVEPNPAAASVLRQLFHGCANVRIIEAALSDTQRETILRIPAGKSVGASIEEDARINAFDQSTSAVVQTMTGDMLAVLEPPDLIKIDAEGHEAAVLRGCAGILAMRPVPVIIEHLYLSDADLSALLPQDYRLQSLNAETSAIEDRFIREAGHNSVLLPHHSPNTVKSCTA